MSNDSLDSLEGGVSQYPNNPANGETNPTLPKEGEAINTGAQPQSEMIQSTPAPSKKQKSLFLRVLVYLAKVVAVVFGTGSTLLFLLALWDSYRPKITVCPGPTIAAKNPFGTLFIIQNAGALPISDVWFDTTWVYADDSNQVRNVRFGLKKIPKLNSLEQHALIELLSTADTNVSLPKPVESIPAPIEHHSLILWFDVTYNPQFFGKRTTTIYFIGMWDSETNFQWLPTGNADIRAEKMDDDLLKRARDFADGLALKNARATNARPVVTNNPFASNSIISTNGSIQIHTNIGALNPK